MIHKTLMPPTPQSLCAESEIYFTVLFLPNVLLADVLGYNTSSTSILIQWSNDTEGHQNVMILNYTITYKELPNGNPQTKVVIAPTTQATLTGLNVYTNYSITVLASNAKGHGNSSNPIIVTTDEDSKSFCS